MAETVWQSMRWGNPTKDSSSREEKTGSGRGYESLRYWSYSKAGTRSLVHYILAVEGVLQPAMIGRYKLEKSTNASGSYWMKQFRNETKLL